MGNKHLVFLSSFQNQFWCVTHTIKCPAFHSRNIHRCWALLTHSKSQTLLLNHACEHTRFYSLLLANKIKRNIFRSLSLCECVYFFAVCCVSMLKWQSLCLHVFNTIFIYSLVHCDDREKEQENLCHWSGNYKWCHSVFEPLMCIYSEIQCIMLDFCIAGNLVGNVHSVFDGICFIDIIVN